MERLTSFLLGVVVGAVLCFGSLKYHVVRANDGVHLVPKLSSSFGDTYVDIRKFGLSDWDQHRALAVAIVNAQKGHLLQDQASDSLRATVDNVIQGLTQPGAGS
jgi:hypothetical protein